MLRIALPLLLLALAASMWLSSGSTPAPSGVDAATAPLPAGWPSTLQIGMADGPGGASAMKATAPFGFRYQYLAGGVNTGGGWANWNAGGNFVTYYVQDSIANGITPVFTYYQIYQSAPGNGQGESSGIASNLGNTSTMAAYWNDMKLFFQRAGAFTGTRIVLQVEPDLWGFTQQRASNDNASTVPAKVGGSGVADVAGLPDNMAGFAQAIDRLRDRYAPNVQIAYHMSTWGTGTNPTYTNPSDSTIDSLSTRAANYFLSLNGGFDLVFAEFTDRDAGFKQYVYGDGGASWWDSGDFTRFGRWLTNFSNTTQKRIVLWQIPLGNTKMRAMNNTWNHYQDNKVEWFLDEASRGRLDAYRQAGVIAFFFGRGADGATCACDGNGDGVTNPAAINGNTLTSLNADDDGGYFRQKAAAYYAAGAMPLGGTSPPPPATPTQPPPPAPTATPPQQQPPATASLTASVVASLPSVNRGQPVWATTTVASNTARQALVDVEVYDPNGNKVFQRFYDGQAFTPNVHRRYTFPYKPASNAATGTYTVKVGVFQPGWAGLLHWNNSATTFIVR